MEPLISQLKNPLSNPTRKVRRSLLLASVLALVIIELGIVPNKVAALGITFSETEQDMILKVLGVVVLYFFISFIVYLTAEYKSWKMALTYEEVEENMPSLEGSEIHSQKDIHEIEMKRGIFLRLYKTGRYHLLGRLSFEVGLPIVLASYTIYKMLFF